MIFDADKVIWFLQPAISIIIGDVHPLRSDDCQEDIALADFLVQDNSKIAAGRNIIHIDWSPGILACFIGPSASSRNSPTAKHS